MISFMPLTACFKFGHAGLVGVVPLNPTWDWIAFGAALLLLPCGVFEACGDAPQNRGEALTLACVPSAPCGNQEVARRWREVPKI